MPASFAGKRLTLVFDGVDHECEVWLNGQRIGRNAGMFRRFWIDATAAAGPARLTAWRCGSREFPPELAPLVPSSDGFQSRGMIAAINKTRQVLKELKSPTNFGWDWGTNVWTLGIWKDVRLVATGPARIDWVRVQTKLNDDFSKAAITATLEIDSLSQQAVQARCKVSATARKRPPPSQQSQAGRQSRSRLKYRSTSRPCGGATARAYSRSTRWTRNCKMPAAVRPWTHAPFALASATSVGSTPSARRKILSAVSNCSSTAGRCAPWEAA